MPLDIVLPIAIKRVEKSPATAPDQADGAHAAVPEADDAGEEQADPLVAKLPGGDERKQARRNGED